MFIRKLLLKPDTTRLALCVLFLGGVSGIDYLVSDPRFWGVLVVGIGLGALAWWLAKAGKK